MTIHEQQLLLKIRMNDIYLTFKGPECLVVSKSSPCYMPVSAVIRKPHNSSCSDFLVTFFQTQIDKKEIELKNKIQSCC